MQILCYKNMYLEIMDMIEKLRIICNKKMINNVSQ